MDPLLQLLFWSIVAGLLYVYVGFPMLLALVALLRPRPVRRAFRPRSVSVIIAAYNEERTIRERIDNVLGQDYPASLVEVLVVSDGSEDETDRLVATHPDRRVRLLRVPRRGKVHALNRAVIDASGELLVFTDANTMFAPGALRKLVRNFSDPQVGGVAGRKVYHCDEESDSCSLGETAYWSYDTLIKRLESLCGSTVSADGAIYAIRRSLYRPVNDAAVTDDFAISTAVVEQGHRLVFDGDAVAHEATVPRAQQEFGRKVRLMTRGLRSVVLRRRLLDPRVSGFYSIQLLSHKVLRRLVPLFLLALAATTISLADRPLFLMACAAQAAFYAAALSGLVLRRTSLGQAKLIALPFFYCLANLAALIALVRLLTGHRVEQWRPQRHAGEA